MDPSPEPAHRRPLQGGPRQTDAEAPPAEALGPRTLASIPESEPLLTGLSIVGENASRKPNGRLHVQFDAQSPPANGSVSGSSSTSSSDDEDLSIAEARPPDGGWGWVVVFASFMVNLIADGITFSFGVFYPHFLEYFGEGKGKTALIAGIFMAMPLLSGPIASFLTDRYGCRRMTIFGAILASIGFVISAFVDNVETLFLTFGIMAGFGLSLCYVAAVVIVAYYFEKKRSLATGISVCGSGIGTFIFAPLTHVLLDEYGWRGTTLILAGFFLNMAVCGLLFRDLPWTATMHEEKAKERKRRRERKRNKRLAASADSFSDSKSSAAGSTKVAETADIETVSSPIVPQFSSLVDLPTYMTGGEGVSLEVFELMSNKGRAYAIMAQNYPGMMLPSRSFSDSGRLHEQSPPRALMSPGTASPGPLSPSSVPPPPENTSTSVPLSDKAAVALWLRRQAGGSTKKPPAFLKDLRIHRHSLTYRGAMLNINRYRLRASSCPNIFRNSMTTIAKEKVQWYAGLWDFWDLAVDVLDFSHFRNPAFLVFTVSNFLLYMWYDVPYVYIPDCAIGIGFDESQASILISMIGILNMFGEILLGWLGDWKCVNPSTVYAVCMVFCGAVTVLMPLLTTYLGLAVASGAFGAFIAANYSLTSIILVEQITLEKFTNAYGLLLLIQGVANLAGPPLAGWIYDITNSYDLSFYLAGVFIGISGLVLVILPICNKAKKYNAIRKAKPARSPSSDGPSVGNGEVKSNGKLIV
ncbi:monocarboxylate transporter 9-like [Battus philenor]|uniref:monocarboxylate transporter 9-like n=1 Tax=Battus philenor TaxID=42288 RepID=UPI0035D0BCE6